MKKVKIFLASSIEDLKRDRLEVGDFFRQLNEIYLDRGIYFSLGQCEDAEKEINDSDLVFFLFFKKVEDNTKHEFEVALDSYRKKNSPKIVTYIKYVNSIEEVNDEVGAFMKMLDGELRHYYNTYGSIDTLKLGMLMQIKNMGLDNSVIDINKGKISINGTELEDCDCYNIPMFSGNTNMQKLKAELESMNKEFCELREQRAANPDDTDLYIKYSDVACKRRKAAENLREVEMTLLNFTAKMLSDRLEGELSDRQKEGYRLFETGDLDGALMVLDREEVSMQIERHGELKKHHRELARQHSQIAEDADKLLQQDVNTLIQRIEVLAAKGLNKETVSDIKKTYEMACDTVEKHNLNRRIMIDYISFLVAHSEFDKATEIGERLRSYYADTEDDALEFEKAALNMTFGQIYMITQRYDEAEKEYIECLGIMERLASQNPKEYGMGLGKAYQNISIINIQRNNREKGEKYAKKAVDIIKMSLGKSPDEDEWVLATAYCNLGAVYMNKMRFDEAEDVYTQALAISEELSKRMPEKYKPQLALTYANLGALYQNSQQYDKAEKVLKKTADIYKRLADDDPELYDGYLFMQYYNLAGLYMKIVSVDRATEFCFKALKLAEKLCAKNPDAYESYLAMSYSLCGGLFLQKERLSEAESAYRKTVEIRTKLTRKTPDVYAPTLAQDYINLGLSYAACSREQEALESLDRAYELIALLNKQKNNDFEAELRHMSDFIDSMKNMIKELGEQKGE